MSKDYLIKILAFDPGLSLSGWNVSTYDTQTKMYRVLKFGMLMPNKGIDTPETHINFVKFGPRVITLKALREQVRELMNTYQPDIVVSEDAFYNPKRPSAYSALIQWLTAVDILLHDEYAKVLFKLAPTAAKQVVSGFGGADKLGVRYAVLHREDICFKSKHAEENLTEHICDSIGIGYTFAHRVLPALTDLWESGYVKKVGEKEPSPAELKQRYS